MIKTGGLADVSGALPKALHDLKQDVRLILPAYQVLLAHAGQLTEVARLTLTGSVEPVRVLEGRLPGTHVVVYLVDAPRCFDRPGNPYLGPDGTIGRTTPQRFAAFCRAIVEVCPGPRRPRLAPGYRALQRLADRPGAGTIKP